MRALVLGYGSMGQRRAMIARGLGHQVVVHDVSVAKTKQAFQDGFLSPFDAPHGDAFTMAQAEAVIICTPVESHTEWLMKARDAGQAFFVEKPLLASASAYEPWLDIMPSPCEQVGYSLRYHPGGTRLRAVLSELGTPYAARFVVALTQDHEKYPDTLLECSHEIDLAFALFGPGTVEGARSRCDGHVWELLIDHGPDGPISSLRVDDRFDGYHRSAVIACEKGSVTFRWHPPDDAWQLVSPIDVAQGTVTVDDIYRAELEDFFAHAGGETRPTGRTVARCSIDDGLAVVRACERARILAEIAHAAV